MEQPKYRKQGLGDFLRLRKAVNRLVAKRKAHENWKIKLKAVLFPLLYLAAYCCLLYFGRNQWWFYGAYLLMGTLLVLNFLNLVHDAVHRTIFQRKWPNKLYVHIFDLLGANSYIWRIRHIKLHHAFPNIMNWDSDFEQSPLVRVFPQAKRKNIHKYQHIYLPFVYPLYLFNWLLVRDFKDFYSSGAIVRKVVDIPRLEYIKLFVFKIIFLSYTIVVPKLVLALGWWVVLSGFILMVFAASLLSLLVLLSPHANVHSDFPRPNDNGDMPYTWLEHQLRCTNDVDGCNFFTRFFMGNFNYHIAHHLFPHVHHVFYPEITKLIKEFAHKNNLPYRQQSLFASLMGHYRLLKQNAVQENIFEETM